MIQHNPPTKLRGYERFPCYGSVSSSSDVAARPPRRRSARPLPRCSSSEQVSARWPRPRPGGGPPNVREAAPLNFAPRSRFNNSCLIDEFAPRSAGADAFDPCRFIVETTDEVWNTRKNVTEALHAYFVDDYIITSTSGTLARGMRELEKLVADSMRAFPTSRSDSRLLLRRGRGQRLQVLHAGLALGTTWAFRAGGPLRQEGKWSTAASSTRIIAKDGKGVWKYVEEFAVHDEWNLMTQLGVLDARPCISGGPGSMRTDHETQRAGFGGSGWRGAGLARVRFGVE